MQIRAKIGILATVALVAAGLVYGFMPRAVPVDIAAVAIAPLVVTVEEEGKTRVRERYVVSAPVSGYLRRIELKAGDAIKPGQVLAVIEPVRSDALDPRTRRNRLRIMRSRWRASSSRWLAPPSAAPFACRPVLPPSI